MLSVHCKVSRSSSSRCEKAEMRMIHWRMRLRTTGCPPRSLNPSFTSSLARTVPKSGHQLTSLSAKYARRNCIRMFDCANSSHDRHWSAVNSPLKFASQGYAALSGNCSHHLASHVASTPANPWDSNVASSSAIGRARSAFRSYQDSNNSAKIHCVHR